MDHGPEVMVFLCGGWEGFYYKPGEWTGVVLGIKMCQLGLTRGLGGVMGDLWCRRNHKTKRRVTKNLGKTICETRKIRRD